MYGFFGLPSAGDGGGSASIETIQALGSKTSAFTVDFAAGSLATVTLGANVTMSLADWGSATQSKHCTVRVQQDPSTPRTLTLGGSNITSSAGILSSGDAVPVTAVANAVDYLEFLWDGAKWAVTNALFDVKS